MTHERSSLTVGVRIALLLALVLGALSAPGETRQFCAGLNVIVDPFAFEEISITNSATIFTIATYAPTGGTAAAMAIVSIEDADIRYRVDGTAPTAARGHLVTNGQAFAVCGVNAVRNFKGIRTASTNAKAMTTYYRAR